MPGEKKAPLRDLLAYLILMYGREKIGKTTWVSSFPDALMAATEPGTKGQNIYEYNHEDGGCHNWDIIQAMRDKLLKTDKFGLVIFDTADRAYDMCLDWVCAKMGIDYPGEDGVTGKQDRGKSWRAVKMEFMTLIHSIVQSGRGVIFTSHSKETEVRTRSGHKYTRIFPSMSGQCRGVVEALVDFFFYVEYVQGPDGTSNRVIVTEGDEVVWAGSREVGFEIPRFIPMTKKGGFEILQAAFNGENVGLNPKTLRPFKQSSDAIRKFFAKAANKPAKIIKKKPGKPNKPGKRRK